jgi:two-component system, NarL family, nitrate/nitrite response regulator NarL
MTRILVADSSRMHTRLLADSLTREGDVKVIPFESDSSGLVAAAADREIDVLVVSSKLDEQPGRGLEILSQVRSLRPDLVAIVLLDSSKDEPVLQAFRSGARGVFDKNDRLELLGKCVRCVCNGQVWANSRQLDVMVRALANTPSIRATNADGVNLLSERELQVVRCLSEGLTNREIAERLNLSQHTVKNYLFRVFEKLGVSSRVELLSMTMTRSASTQSSDAKKDNGYSPVESDLIEDLAQAGLPAAQLALAQVYLARRNGPQDLVDAYMWYLVAIERAGKAKDFITNLLTPSQLEESRRKAAAWSPMQKQSDSSSEKPELQLKRPGSKILRRPAERSAL